MQDVGTALSVLQCLLTPLTTSTLESTAQNELGTPMKLPGIRKLDPLSRSESHVPVYCDGQYDLLSAVTFAQNKRV